MPIDDDEDLDDPLASLPTGPLRPSGEGLAELDGFDENDFDDEFDDDFEDELEDEYELKALEGVSEEELAAEEADDLSLLGDFVDEDAEPEEPELVAEEPVAEEPPPPKAAKGKKGKKVVELEEDDEDDLDDDED